jgi:hypothetical protein
MNTPSVQPIFTACIRWIVDYNLTVELLSRCIDERVQAKVGHATMPVLDIGWLVV